MHINDWFSIKYLKLYTNKEYEFEWQPLGFIGK